jgi:hypothetical protein
MKKLLLSAFLITGLTALSQITITNTNMPSAGDTLRLSIGSIASFPLNYATGGANETWAFDSLKPTSQMMRDFKTASSINPFFFSSTCGEKTADTLDLFIAKFSNIHNIYKKSASAFAQTGVSMQYTAAPFPIPSNYTDMDELYMFPLNYGDRDSTTFKFSTPSFSAIPFTYKKEGYRITEADGWGTLSTPFGQVQCLRVVTTQYSQDSIKLTIPTGSITVPFNIGFPNYIRSYQWLTLGEKVPYVEITGNMLFGAFVPTQVRYRDYPRTFVGVNEIPAEIALGIYPNPAVNELNIIIPKNKNYNLEIYDASGHVIIQKQLNNENSINKHGIDVSGLASGIYLGKITDGKTVQNFKFNKQ